MNVDIDQFIRDQKSKIAEERNYIAKNAFVDNGNVPIKNTFYSNDQSINNGDFVLKMREGESMKNKYKQELRNEFSTIKKLETPVEQNSSRKEKISIENSDDEGLLYGFKYSNSATKRKEKIRNEEYNQFKAMEEEKFKNRFSNQKNSTSKRIPENNSYIQSNPISSNLSISDSSKLKNQFNKQTQETSAVEYFPTNSNPRMFESKIDELERKVEELRNFRIQNPFIIYPNDENMIVDNSGKTRYSSDHEKSNHMRYSNTSLGQNHLRYLEQTEQRLREMEDKYDRKKTDFITNGKGSLKKLSPIFDDDEHFSRGEFDKRPKAFYLNEKQQQIDSKSIIPMGRGNDELLKKKKQDEYREQLQSQMKEKLKKSKSNDSIDNTSFFDKFGQKEVTKKREVLIDKIEKDNDYFFYASHNPLDEFDTSVNQLSNETYLHRSNEMFHLPDSNLQKNNNKKDSNLFFGERDNQSNKGTYRNELMKQIEESKMRKDIEKKKLEDYERRKNEEIARYEPFGRGGGGAPLKNDKGETISDLKRIQFDPDIVKRDPPALNTNLSARPEFQTQNNTEPLNSQRGFARGGNGIFGNALSDEDKVKADRYKEELKMQIEKNRRQKDVDKENERKREEKERIKFENDQKLIQIELENERKNQQKKEIEHQRIVEESKMAASKEKERIKKTKLENEQKSEEQIKSARIITETKKEDRIFSPIIRNKTPYNDQESLQDRSKLEMEASSRAHINREDSKIMSQLYKLKNQLESEKIRVEQALIRQRDEVEIYDPRLNKNNPLKNADNNDDTFNSDVFQAIVDNRKPLTVRRDHLKHKSVTPRKYKNTEADLDEYLKQQEKLLERMYQKDFSKLELMMPKMEPQHIGLRPSTQMSNQLESDSHFIQFDQSNDFNLRNIHSQASDIDYHFTKPRSPKVSEFGSNTSLNIDELTRKNQQRLRKLQKLQDENDYNQSSEDILNKIVAKNNFDPDLFNRT